MLKIIFFLFFLGAILLIIPINISLYKRGMTNIQKFIKVILVTIGAIIGCSPTFLMALAYFGGGLSLNQMIALPLVVVVSLFLASPYYYMARLEGRVEELEEKADRPNNPI